MRRSRTPWILLERRDPRGDVSWDGLLYAPNLYGYYVPSLAASLWDFPVAEVMKPLNVINSVLFCVSRSTRSHRTFSSDRDMGARHRAWCAAAAVMFFVLQFGVNVFSFMRYYVYAPAFINYLLYLSAAALLIEYYRTGSWRAGLPVFGLVFVVAYLIHKQEAMFIILMTSLLIAVEFFRSRRRPLRPEPGDGRGSVFSGACRVGGALDRVVHRAPALQSAGIQHHSCRSSSCFRSSGICTWLDPTFQFYEVLAVWGIVVYALFFSALFRVKGCPVFSSPACWFRS